MRCVKWCELSAQRQTVFCTLVMIVFTSPVVVLIVLQEKQKQKDADAICIKERNDR